MQHSRGWGGFLQDPPNPHPLPLWWFWGHCSVPEQAITTAVGVYMAEGNASKITHEMGLQERLKDSS